MHLMYFTEQPMSAYPEQEGRDFGATALMFSNRHFDPVAGSRLYNEYLEHYRLAEDVGFDGIMLNEHHNAPFCMQAKCNVFASILAAGLDEQPAADILAVPEDFYADLGLAALISPLRLRGLSAMLARIKRRLREAS